MYELQDNPTSRVAMWSGIFSSMSTIQQSQNIPAPNTLSVIHTLVGFTTKNNITHFMSDSECQLHILNW